MPSQDKDKVVDERRRAQNRIAQRNYRQNIKNKIASLEIINQHLLGFQGTSEFPAGSVPSNGSQPHSDQSLGPAAGVSAAGHNTTALSPVLLPEDAAMFASQHMDNLQPAYDMTSSNVQHSPATFSYDMMHSSISSFPHQYLGAIDGTRRPSVDGEALSEEEKAARRRDRSGYFPSPSLNGQSADYMDLLPNVEDDGTFTTDASGSASTSSGPPAAGGTSVPQFHDLYAPPPRHPSSPSTYPDASRTPLHQAIANSHPKVARLLLSSGADIHATDCRGYTPLHTCAESGDAATAKLLLEHGALPEVKEHHGLTPLQVAAAHGQNQVVEVLVMQGARIDASLQDAHFPQTRS